MLLLFGIVSVWLVTRNRYLILKMARPGCKIHTIARQVCRGNLNDHIIKVMLAVLSSETIGTYYINSELIHKAGLKLSKYGTPESCLLATHLSNYSNINYSEAIHETIREASCNFTGNSRIIEIIRGKYLYQDQDFQRQTDQVTSSAI